MEAPGIEAASCQREIIADTVGLDLFKHERCAFMNVFMSQATYRCIGTGSRSDLEELCRAVTAHQVHPVIDRAFSLEDAKAAWAHFAGRRLFGKVVIDHNQS